MKTTKYNLNLPIASLIELLKDEFGVIWEGKTTRKAPILKKIQELEFPQKSEPAIEPEPAPEQQSVLPPVKKIAKSLTIEDLEAKLKKLGLNKDLFVCKGIRNPDKGWMYFIHDVNWYPANRATFESYSAAAVSRQLTKIYKERQAAKVSHSLVVVPSQAVDVEKEKTALSPVSKASQLLTIEDLEAKIKKLGLDKDVFVIATVATLDKPQKFILHDINWNLLKPTTFSSKSATYISRALTKIHKERQAAQASY